MLLFDAPLTFREFMTDEKLPLATIFREVLGALRGRRDVVLFGAQAVNAWCEPARMTADVDLLSTQAEKVAGELRMHLSSKFRVAMRVREVVPGGFRLYQQRKPKNRHLVDVRQVEELPAFRLVGGLQVAAPAELLAMKVTALAKRAASPKGDTDRADLRRLMLAFPKLRERDGQVAARLRALGADAATLAMWRELARVRPEPDADDGY